MSKLLKTWFPMLLLWGASMLGALQLTSVQSKWSDSACGPWGCGPTVESLVACHVFWLVFLSLPGAWAMSAFSRSHRRKLGLALMGAGLLVLLGIGVDVATNWYPNVSGFQQAYWKQRYVYQVALLTDVPAVQCVFLGGLMWCMSRKDKRTETHSTEATPFSPTSTEHASA